MLPNLTCLKGGQDKNQIQNNNNLVESLEAVVKWLKQSWSRLNPSKMKVLWLGGGDTDLGSQLLTLNGAPSIPALTFKSLDMIRDASLTIETQTTNVAKLVFLQLLYAKSSNWLPTCHAPTQPEHSMQQSPLN